MFKHAIAEGVAGMVVTHLMVSIGVKRMERDTEVNMEADTKTTHEIETWNNSNLTRRRRKWRRRKSVPLPHTRCAATTQRRPNGGQC